MSSLQQKTYVIIDQTDPFKSWRHAQGDRRLVTELVTLHADGWSQVSYVLNIKKVMTKLTAKATNMPIK